jgi:hypothetical protein
MRSWRKENKDRWLDLFCPWYPSLIISNTKVCTFCSEAKQNLRKCSGCFSVAYCGVDCQRNHWKVHKSECDSMAVRIIGSQQQPQNDSALLMIPVELLRNIVNRVVFVSSNKRREPKSYSYHHASPLKLSCVFLHDFVWSLHSTTLELRRGASHRARIYHRVPKLENLIVKVSFFQMQRDVDTLLSTMKVRLFLQCHCITFYPN